MDYTRRVQVFYNLHKHCFSVRQDGRLVEHTEALALRKVRFLVQPAGREKVRATGVKNVHAFVTGYPSRIPYTVINQTKTRVRYNPYKNDTFVDEQGAPIGEAHSAVVYLDSDGKPVVEAFR